MSLAWGSLVLLVVLLPGVLFFVGVYLPEQFTREIETQSALGQLAGVLLIAIVVHLSLYTILTPFCDGWMPCIRVDLLLDTINLDSKTPGATVRLNEMFKAHHIAILAYILTSGSAGVGLGWVYGRLVSHGALRQLSRHPWAHELNVTGMTIAHVMTHLKHDDRYLVYKGFLRAFGLQKDGRFSYIILSGATRSYLQMLPGASMMSPIDDQRTIGESTPGNRVPLPNSPSTRRERRASMFVIEGEDAANVVFDLLKAPSEAMDQTDLDQFVAQIHKEFDAVAKSLQRETDAMKARAASGDNSQDTEPKLRYPFA